MINSANAEVAATIARMKEYQEASAQFSKRILDYLDVTFKYQVSPPVSVAILSDIYSRIPL